VHKERRRTTPNSRHYKKGVSLQGLRRRNNQLRTFLSSQKTLKQHSAIHKLCIQGKEKNTLPQWTLQEVYVRERRPEEQPTQGFLSFQKTLKQHPQVMSLCIHEEEQSTPPTVDIVGG
jgi:hypothetical protein